MAVVDFEHHREHHEPNEQCHNYVDMCPLKASDCLKNSWCDETESDASLRLSPLASRLSPLAFCPAGERGIELPMLRTMAALGILVGLIPGCGPSPRRSESSSALSSSAPSVVSVESQEPKLVVTPPLPPPLPEMDPAFLALLHRSPSKAKELLTQARTAMLSTLRFSSSSPAATAPADNTYRYNLRVLERLGDLVRIHMATNHMVLIGWIPFSDLAANAVVIRTPLLESAASKATQHYIEVLPGVQVDVLEEKGDWLRVHAALREPCLSTFVDLEGWLPRSAVGSIYTILSVPMETNGKIENTTTITDRSGRRVLARLRPDDDDDDELLAQSLGKVRGGQQEVLADLGNAIVRGFVPAKSFVPSSPGGGGCGGGVYHPTQLEKPLSSKLRLQRNTCLFDAQDQLAGLSIRAQDVTGRDEGNGIWTVRFPSPWGDLDMRVRETSPDSSQGFVMCDG